MDTNENVSTKPDNYIEKSYQGLRWTSEIIDCSLPVTLDTYNNCSFSCRYCFSQFIRGNKNFGEDYWGKKVKAVNPEKLKALFRGDLPNNQFHPYISTRRPIQYGGRSDQFDGFERKFGVTYEIIKFLKEINYPISFSTKSTWVFHDDKYRAIFQGADNWSMKFSIITLDENDARRIEVGVPSPQKRLEAMREYTKLSKGDVVLRLRPFIIGVSDKNYLDLIRAAADAGAKALSTEFLCFDIRNSLRPHTKENFEIIGDVCGFDVKDFYMRHSNNHGYLRLNREIKAPYIKKMRDLCNQLGMRFYVSDAHFKELCDNCCCCGLSPDYDYSRGNFSQALYIAKQKGYVTFSDIGKDMDFLENLLWRKAIGYNTNNAMCNAKFYDCTMKDFLRYEWNNPKRERSPYKQFGHVLIPDGYDENGDIIYKYNPSVSL